MPAQLKIFTDSGHASEVAHTAQNSTTTAGGTQGIGTISLQVASTASMPAQGYVDIDTAGNFETLPYASIIDSTHIGLAKATAISHAISVAVVQWYYSLAVGDQSLGIVNDGTNATPNSPTNVATWYCYNAGDQTAQTVSLATASGAPDTTLGLSDTLISITSASASFAASVTPANITAGSQQQFWLVAEIATGQSNVANPQICQMNITFQSV
jgi:hypothetical protein